MVKSIEELKTQLVNNGGEIINKVIVEKITLTKLDKYNRVILKLNKPIKQLVVNSNGDLEEGMRDLTFMNDFSIKKCLSYHPDASFLTNIIMNSPKLLHYFLEGAEVEILLEHVPEGYEYENPFASKAESVVIEHDDIITHIVDIRLTYSAYKILRKFEDIITSLPIDDFLSVKIREKLSDEEVDTILYSDFTPQNNQYLFMIDENSKVNNII